MYLGTVVIILFICEWVCYFLMGGFYLVLPRSAVKELIITHPHSIGISKD